MKFKMESDFRSFFWKKVEFRNISRCVKMAAIQIDVRRKLIDFFSLQEKGKYQIGEIQNEGCRRGGVEAICSFTAQLESTAC